MPSPVSYSGKWWNWDSLRTWFYCSPFSCAASDNRCDLLHLWQFYYSPILGISILRFRISFHKGLNRGTPESGLGVGSMKISLVRCPLLLHHPQLKPTLGPPHSSMEWKVLSVSLNHRVGGSCDQRKAQILKQACSCTANCLNIMDRSLSYYGFFVGKLFIQCWLTPEL